MYFIETINKAYPKLSNNTHKLIPISINFNLGIIGIERKRNLINDKIKETI
jgi:hypothetical protein